MSSRLYILATCLDLKLLPATLLVFRSLRVGFPNAAVTVWGNGLALEAEKAVRDQCCKIDASFVSITTGTSHDIWIEKLLNSSPDPFWICDTDVVFFEEMESLEKVEMIVGRYEPPFVEPWSGTYKVDRLHTSLMWMNAPKLRVAVRNWIASWHPGGFPFRPGIDFVRQRYVPNGPGKPPLFYDTCAGLYQAFGGQKFTDRQNNCFEHLHCGAYSNRIEKVMPGIYGVHQKVFEDLNAARGLSEQQSAFYKDHAIQ